MKKRIAHFFLIISCTAALCSGTALGQAGGALNLPSPPSADSLEQKFPACDLKLPIPGLNQCLSKLELFRQLNLEQYRNEVLDFGKALNRLDRRLEKAHAAKTVDDDDYSDLHDEIADALKKTASAGIYMLPYSAYFEKYQGEVASTQKQIRCRTFSFGNCNQV